VLLRSERPGPVDSPALTPRNKARQGPEPSRTRGGSTLKLDHEQERQTRPQGREGRVMSVHELVATFATIHDRAALIAFLAPLRLPRGLSDDERARVTSALIAAASRCWRRS